MTRYSLPSDAVVGTTLIDTTYVHRDGTTPPKQPRTFVAASDADDRERENNQLRAERDRLAAAVRFASSVLGSLRPRTRSQESVITEAWEMSRAALTQREGGEG